VQKTLRGDWLGRTKTPEAKEAANLTEGGPPAKMAVNTAIMTKQSFSLFSLEPIDIGDDNPIIET